MERMQHENGNGPSLPPSARRGGDFRSLIRSRGVQALLGVALVAQVTTIATREPQTKTADGKARSARIVIPAPEAVSMLALLPAAEAKPGTAAEKAGALAEKYRGKGFPVTEELARTIVREAEAHGIAAELAFGLVATESEFKRTAKSPVGAIGLAQLMPATARLLEPGTTAEDLKQPETNLRIGFRYLGELIDRYKGDTALALTAYNRGTGTVDRILEKGGDPDNGYAGKVLSGGHNLVR